MKLVVKIGGEALEEPALRRALARQIAELWRAGHRVVVVHGGGKLLSETLKRLGIASQFCQGLRVTDAAARDVALMVLAGITNKRLVAELEAQGQPALGICGGDARLVEVRKLSVRQDGQTKDLGFVGRPRKISTAILEMALERGLLPVVASLALGPRGEYFNVNADDLAAALAMALKADRLLYLTEADGVWDSERRRLPVVRLQEIPRLIRKGIVRDGMIPKLRSCARTLRHDVREVNIVSARAPQVLLRVLQNRERMGTRIVKSA